MRTVTLKSILDGVASLLGVAPAELLDEDKAAIAEAVTERCREGWEYDFWPEWTPVELRTYRPVYGSGTTYAEGDQVYFPAADKYYQALAATLGNAPATLTAGTYETNLAYWADCAASYEGDDWAASTAYALGDIVRRLEDGYFYQCKAAHTSGASFSTGSFSRLYEFRPYVALNQAGQTLIGEVARLCGNDPRIHPGAPNEIPHLITAEGIVPLTSAVPNRIYVEFRLRPPLYGTVDWSGSIAYAAGDIVYLASTGECYLALQASTNQNPATATTYWTKQDVPHALAQFIKRAAYCDMLRGDEQHDKALAEERRAYAALSNAHDVAFAGQGQYTVARVVTG
jgi:hypothetical protein